MATDIKKLVDDQKWAEATQWFQAFHAHLQDYFRKGFHLVEAPINGIDSRVKEIAAEVEGWFETHEAARGKKFAPTLQPDLPPPVGASPLQGSFDALTKLIGDDDEKLDLETDAELGDAVAKLHSLLADRLTAKVAEEATTDDVKVDITPATGFAG